MSFGIARDTIKIEINEPVLRNTRDYFSQLRIIPLETNDESIIHRIDRIIIDGDFLYVLDRTQGVILTFDKDGRFLRKLSKKGRGPEEYISLVDFALDHQAEQFSVLADRPYELIKYDLNGNFIGKSTLPIYFKAIANNDGQDIFFNTVTQSENGDDFFVWFKSKSMYTKRLPIDKSNDFYNHGTLIVESRNLSFTKRYDNTVMQIDGQDLIPAYRLDFGKNWLSDKDFAGNIDDVDFFTSECLRRNICHSVLMIRETKNYLVFTTNLFGFFIYNKLAKTMEHLSALQDDEIGYVCANYFAHDGDDDRMLFMFSYRDLQNILKYGEKNLNPTPDCERILDIASTAEPDSNPVLLLYTFK